MKMRYLYLVVFVIFACILNRVNGQTNGFLREVYTGINGTSIADLTSTPSFPASPALEDLLTNYFEAPTDWADNYGTRVRGLIIPPQTGNYIFWIASDDNSQLYLSTDDSPNSKRLIASVNSWTSSRQWDKEANQMSAPIRLTNGMRYYIEALQKEGGGGDNLAVGWQLPDGTLERPIPATRAVPYGLGPPSITVQPQNVSVVEGGQAVFSIQLARYIGITFQWYLNGTNIPGANSASYILGPVALSDSGSTFRCVVSNAYGVQTSSVATLTVLPDTTPPRILSAGSSGQPNIVAVYFSEPLEPASATNAANYQIDKGVSVLSARFGLDDSTVILITTPMAYRTTYTLTVNNLRDRATTPNTILRDSQASFRLEIVTLETYKQYPQTEPIGPSSRRSPIIISEVMYHPTNRADGRNLEYIEIYNSQPWFEELGGWQITGSITYTFPSNFVLGSNAFVVIAANPADIKAVYNITNVLGPFDTTNSLPDDSGKLQLRNKLGAIMFEMEYSDKPPYPASADGGGHSLTLVRPSLGERNPEAWGQSEIAGGSPGRADYVIGNPYRTVMINEFLANSGTDGLDYIELFNYHTQAVAISGCIITDDPETNKFVVPSGTTIPALGFIRFDRNQLGFGLDSGGGKILFKHPSGNRVIDSIRYEEQEPGVPMGRYPDGAPDFYRLSRQTPGTNNAAPLYPDVIINEIMYEPITGNKDDEYVELHNRGTNAINIGRWRIRGGISYTLPSNTTIPPGGFIVIARNSARLLQTHPGLSSGIVFGDFDGSLSNTGERLTLEKPVTVITTNEFGELTTKTYRVVVDEVWYKPGGRWGKWSSGGGSSLERIDPRADDRYGYNWTDSDESQKSPWVTVEATGVLDHGNGDASALHIILMGPGECLVDDVEVIPAGGANLVPNSNFDNNAGGWFFQGNHSYTSYESGTGFGGGGCLHVRATGRGDTGANRVRVNLTRGLSAGTIATLRAKVRWLKGSPQILLRLRGNWLEAPGDILATYNLGSPGLPNSRLVQNAGPAIANVFHYPYVPSAGQHITVSARINDPDGIAALVLRYRVDPSTNYIPVSMVNRGAGWYSATIPGQSSGAVVAFYIQTLDAHPSLPVQTFFPNDAPERECVVRWGDPVISGKLGVYRVWMTQKFLNRWINREKLSNDPLDVTFVYGTNRVVYNVGAQYSGSPWHSPSYNSPIGNNCDYVLTFPKDDLFLGEEDINLLQPGNGGGDSTLQAEQQAYWIAGKMGLPICYRRSVHLFINGVRRGMLFEDAQQPNADFVEEWYPDDSEGDLHKIQLWFEFDDLASSFSAVGADLGKYLTTGGVKKLARYRWTWAKRAYGNDANNYTNLFALVDIVNTSATGEAYTRTIQSAIDVEQWYKTHVVEHIVGNNDSYSYGGGQNMYAYKPQRGLWNLLIWDIDFAFFAQGPTSDLFGIGGAQHGPRNNHPPFARLYWQCLIKAANGPLLAEQANPILDARYNAFRADGISPSSPQSIKDYIATRRSYILGLVQNNTFPFEITSNGGVDFETNRNLLVLNGTAPLEVRTIKVNGVAYDAIWTTLSNWTIRVPLKSGLNTLTVQGYDGDGNLVSGTSDVIRVNFTGIDESPVGKVVINEIMYNPQIPGASYIELYNTSTNNAFDLSDWRIEGVDFTFTPGTIIQPGEYLLVVKDAQVFANVYGATIPIASEFSGSLNNSGETIRLIKPDKLSGKDIVISAVTYEDVPPWPVAADGSGPSLQLIDPTQDASRVANWTAAIIDTNSLPQTLITMTDVWRYNQTADLSNTNWTSPQYDDSNWQSGAALLYVENASLSAPKNTPLTLGRITYYFRKKFVFNGNPYAVSLKLYTIIDDGAVFYLNGYPVHRIRMPSSSVTYSTLANSAVGDATIEGPFILPSTYLVKGTNVFAVEVHQISSGSSDTVFGMSLETTIGNVAPYTPGTNNSVRASLPAFPSLWLNEIQPWNLNGITDNYGQKEPWLEIYNSGATSINLSNYYLTDDLNNLTKWQFPNNTVIGAGEFKLVWLDGESVQTTLDHLHTSFRVSQATGLVALVSVTGQSTNLVDYLNYSMLAPDRSYGSYPEGTAAGRRLFAIPTPGVTNNPAYPPISVFINEWMADNSGTLADPVDNDYEDWFELYNPSSTPINISGYYLSDSLTQWKQFEIPSGYIIPAGGFLLVWADGEHNQNSVTNPHLHVSFRLSAGGEAIGLFAPDGTMVDGVVFGQQQPDISEGRHPDGSAVINVFTNSTPGLPNLLAEPNLAPIMEPIPNFSVVEGQLLTFQVAVTDPNKNKQNLTFSLEPGAPPGAYIDPVSGVFSWIPSEIYGGESYPITIKVTDDGEPPLSATRTFTVSVEKTNSPPSIIVPGNQVVNEGEQLSFYVNGADTDLPQQQLTFSLDASAPAGAKIHPTTGLFTWTPSEVQGPGIYSFLIYVTDNGEPPMNDSRRITITVNEVNSPPVFNANLSQTTHLGCVFEMLLPAYDTDIPKNKLNFSFLNTPPAGTTLNPDSGLFSWRPGDNFAFTTNTFTVRVSDDGDPPLSTTNTFTIVILDGVRIKVFETNQMLGFSWNTIPGRKYQLQYKDKFSIYNWSDIGQIITATGTNTIFIYTNISQPSRFFRVISPE